MRGDGAAVRPGVLTFLEELDESSGGKCVRLTAVLETFDEFENSAILSSDLNPRTLARSELAASDDLPAAEKETLKAAAAEGMRRKVHADCRLLPPSKQLFRGELYQLLGDVETVTAQWPKGSRIAKGGGGGAAASTLIDCYSSSSGPAEAGSDGIAMDTDQRGGDEVVFVVHITARLCRRLERTFDVVLFRKAVKLQRLLLNRLDGEALVVD